MTAPAVIEQLTQPRLEQFTHAVSSFEANTGALFISHPSVKTRMEKVFTEKLRADNPDEAAENPTLAFRFATDPPKKDGDPSSLSIYSYDTTDPLNTQESLFSFSDLILEYGQAGKVSEDNIAFLHSFYDALRSEMVLLPKDANGKLNPSSRGQFLSLALSLTDIHELYTLSGNTDLEVFVKTNEPVVDRMMAEVVGVAQQGKGETQIRLDEEIQKNIALQQKLETASQELSLAQVRASVEQMTTRDETAPIITQSDVDVARQEGQTKVVRIAQDVLSGKISLQQGENFSQAIKRMFPDVSFLESDIAFYQSIYNARASIEQMRIDAPTLAKLPDLLNFILKTGESVQSAAKKLQMDLPEDLKRQLEATEIMRKGAYALDQAFKSFTNQAIGIANIGSLAELRAEREFLENRKRNNVEFTPEQWGVLETLLQQAEDRLSFPEKTKTITADSTREISTAKELSRLYERAITDIIFANTSVSLVDQRKRISELKSKGTAFSESQWTLLNHLLDRQDERLALPEKERKSADELVLKVHSGRVELGRVASLVTSKAFVVPEGSTFKRYIQSRQETHIDPPFTEAELSLLDTIYTQYHTVRNSEEFERTLNQGTLEKSRALVTENQDLRTSLSQAEMGRELLVEAMGILGTERGPVDSGYFDILISTYNKRVPDLERQENFRIQIDRLRTISQSMSTLKGEVQVANQNASKSLGNELALTKKVDALSQEKDQLALEQSTQQDLNQRRLVFYKLALNGELSLNQVAELQEAEGSLDSSTVAILRDIVVMREKSAVNENLIIQLKAEIEDAPQKAEVIDARSINEKVGQMMSEVPDEVLNPLRESKAKVADVISVVLRDLENFSSGGRDLPVAVNEAISAYINAPDTMLAVRLRRLIEQSCEQDLNNKQTAQLLGGSIQTLFSRGLRDSKATTLQDRVAIANLLLSSMKDRLGTNIVIATVDVDQDF